MNARTADGAPTEASVVIRHDNGEVVQRYTLSGHAEFDWDDNLPTRPWPAHSCRVFVAVTAPPHNFVRITPRERVAS